jgi:hypothetical protein
MFTEPELDRYLDFLQKFKPDLRARVQFIARKFIGQPYEIYLLGEFPFEIYDRQPLYSLGKSDCVVFSEHVYAMALSHDWRSFITMLQRIRYKDGRIGMMTRNHYTEYDWDRNNSWLVEDITERLAGDRVVRDTTVIDKARFFSKYGIGAEIPPDKFIWSYIPYQLLPEIIDSLQAGDFVNIVRGYGGGRWVGHVGLVTVNPDGTRNFLHSTSPQVKEEPLLQVYDGGDPYNQRRESYNAYLETANAEIRRYNESLQRNPIKRLFHHSKKYLTPQPYFLGFKFLRLRANPLTELHRIDGPDAPRIIFSAGPVETDQKLIIDTTVKSAKEPE